MNATALAQLGSLIRHLLSALGGFLTAHGLYAGTAGDFVDQLLPASTQIAGGLLTWLIAHVAAWLRNRGLRAGPPPPAGRSRAWAWWMFILLPFIAGCHSTPKPARAPGAPAVDPFDRAIDRFTDRLFRPLLVALLLLICLPACAPYSAGKWDPKTGQFAFVESEGFLHSADAIATEITLPGGFKVARVLRKPDGTKVANNAITLGIPAIQATKAIQSNNAFRTAESRNNLRLGIAREETKRAATAGAQNGATTQAGINGNLFQKEATPFTQPPAAK